MINKHTQRKYCRPFGAPRKPIDIYKNLGHPYDIKAHKVIFIGSGKQYCLTPGNEYIILNTKNTKHCFDNDLRKRFNTIIQNNKETKKYERNQADDYNIVIVNDLGHKRQYSHTMFKNIK